MNQATLAISPHSWTRIRVVVHHFKTLVERTEIMAAPGKTDWVGRQWSHKAGYGKAILGGGHRPRVQAIPKISMLCIVWGSLGKEKEMRPIRRPTLKPARTHDDGASGGLLLFFFFFSSHISYLLIRRLGCGCDSTFDGMAATIGGPEFTMANFAFVDHVLAYADTNPVWVWWRYRSFQGKFYGWSGRPVIWSHF